MTKPHYIVTTLLLVTALLSVHSGVLHVSWHELLQSSLGHGTTLTQFTLWQLRLPRLLTGMMCGALMSAAGTLLQSTLRNPLASPDIIGVCAGAALTITLYLCAFPAGALWGMALAGLIGALLGFSLVYKLSSCQGIISPYRLLLVGIATGTCFLSLRHFILIFAPDNIGNAVVFLSGSLYDAAWPGTLAVWGLGLPLLIITCLLSRSLNQLSLGDAVASTLGCTVKQARCCILIVASLLAGTAVVGAGVLGFVGLVAPHLARLLTGTKHERLLPLAMLLGALLVCLGDMLGRSLHPPIEIPAGIITTLLGAPYFLWVLQRQGRRT